MSRLLDDPNVRMKYLVYVSETGQKNTSAYRIGCTTAAIDEYLALYPSFQREYAEAYGLFQDKLTRAALQRAVDGVLEPIHAGKDGDLKGYVRKYSDRLLETLMKGHDPRYQDKIRLDAEVNHNVSGKLDIAHVVATLNLDGADFDALKSLERLLESTVQHPPDLTLAEAPELTAMRRNIPGGRITGPEIVAASEGEVLPPSQRRGGIDMSLDTEEPILTPFISADEMEKSLAKEFDDRQPKELDPLDSERFNKD